MKRYFQFLLIALIISFSSSAFAQQLQGKLSDENGEAVSFANVAILQTSDSSLVSGAVSDMEGNFKLKSPAPGQYMLRLTAISFTTTYTDAFEVKENNFTKDFGTLTLSEDVKVLGSVEVKAMRPTVVAEADKMVVSVENTALAAGSTAYEVLAKSPGVWVDQNGDIQLNGKSGVKIMLDGRSTYISAEELRSMLQSMSAENIKNIELITNPSAKYDAEGSSGIINIQLKKNTANGLNGSMHGGYTYNGMYAYSSGANINLKKGKWNSSANLEFNRGPLLRDSRMDRVFYNSQGQKTDYGQDGHEKRATYSPSVRLATDYEINEKHSIGGMANVSVYKRHNNFDTETDQFSPEQNLNELAIAKNTGNRLNLNRTFNFHYDGQFNEATTFSANLDYIKLDIEGDAAFDNQFTDRNTDAVNYVNLATENFTGFNIYSARLDFGTKLFDKVQLDLGTKASQVTSENGLDYFTVQNGERLLDQEKSSEFIYREQILAGYINMSTSLSEKFTLQGGLRAEHTIGTNLTSNQKVREYLNFFPSIFLQHKVNDNYQVSYSYSRRIDRPRYTALNPFIFYIDPYTVVQGKQDLKPQYTNALQVTQTLNKTYNLVLGYSVTENLIAEVPIMNGEDRTTTYSYNNVDHFRNISATLVAPVKVTGWWDMNNNLIFAHQQNSMMIDDNEVKNSLYFFMGQSTQNFQLPWDIRMEVNAGYSSDLTWGIYTIGSYWWVDTGFKKTFMSDKLNVSLGFNDIFRSRRQTAVVQMEQNISDLDQYFNHQAVRLSLRYNFSKGNKFKSKNKNRSIEELKRAGG